METGTENTINSQKLKAKKKKKKVKERREDACRKCETEVQIDNLASQ